MAIPPISPYPIPTPSTTLPADCPARSWALEPARAALLVHDMQKYLLAAYDWNKEPLHSALANIARLITTADQLGIPVFYSAQPPQQHPTRRGLLSDMWGQDTHEVALFRIRAHGPLPVAGFRSAGSANYHRGIWPHGLQGHRGGCVYEGHSAVCDHGRNCGFHGTGPPGND